MNDATAQPRLLVIAPETRAELILAQGFCKALVERYPDAPVDLVVDQEHADLARGMPEIDQVIATPALRWSTTKALGRTLRGNYSHAWVLSQSWHAARLVKLAKIRQRTGWPGFWRARLLNDIRPLPSTDNDPVRRRFRALLDDCPALPATNLTIKAVEVMATLQALSLEKKARRPILAICPHGQGPAQAWPADYFGTLARAYHQLGWEVWLFGEPRDQDLCAQIQRAAEGNCRNLAGRLDLAQTTQLMSLAEAVVSNDSWYALLAAALERPCVRIHGASDPQQLPLRHAKVHIARLELDCSPCGHHDCPLGHTDCLNKLGIGDIVQAIEGLVLTPA